MSSPWFTSFWQVDHLPGSIIVHMQLCMNFQDFASPDSYLHQDCTRIISGYVAYLFRQLGWYWASQSQMSYPLIHRRKSWSYFKPLQFWLQLLHHQIKIWIGALLSKMCFLDFLTPIWVTENAVGVGHKSVTQRPFRSWMSSLSALTSRTG